VARHGDAAGDFLDVAKHRQAVSVGLGAW
ncbi:uncharacterized protein METZ01_LOCUS206173, partial [marine metagenome]